MTLRPCGGPCPVPARPPGVVRTHVWPAGTVLHRGVRAAHPDPTQLVDGLGDTRFAPMDGVAHTYLSTTAFGALLESVLHDAAPPTPRVQLPTLRTWREETVVLTEDVRLVDLRDTQLQTLGVTRDQVVATAPLHYRCTRAWAAQLHGRVVGGQQTHGLLWHSRQAELHAAAAASQRRPALADLLDEHPTEVAVLWSPPADPAPLGRHDGGLGQLHLGPGWQYVRDAMVLLGILLDPG